MSPSEFYGQGPLRRLQWRLDRVIELLRHRPQPLRPRYFDDGPIRVYWRLLLELTGVPEDDERYATICDRRAAVWHAHQLHYSADVERRQILEARLLTNASFAEIAHGFATEPQAIESFEALFFNVRDRFSNTDWINKVIRGEFGIAPDGGRSELAVEARGYVLRLFAFYGGPLVLDTRPAPVRGRRRGRVAAGDAG